MRRNSPNISEVELLKMQARSGDRRTAFDHSVQPKVMRELPNRRDFPDNHPRPSNDNYTKPNKHRNIKVIVDGLAFDSAKEAATWNVLKLREHAGEISFLSRQVTFPFWVSGVRVGHARVDFTWIDSTGKFCVGDAKSAHTRTLHGWKRTKQLLLACYGFELAEM